MALVSGGVFAQAMKTHVDKKAKFSIQHPGNWKKQVNKDGLNLMLISKDKYANVIVVREDVPEGTTTAAYLSKAETDAGDSRTNMIPEDKRAAAPEDTKNMNVDEASLGVYQIEKDGEKLNQMFMVMRKGTAMYAVIISFQDAAADKYKDIVTKIGDSFKALK